MSWKTLRWIGALAAVLVGGPARAGDILVPPSGDTSGATDANNIEAAWYAAGPNDEVVLSDGDSSTVDHYYVNRVMVASSFGTKNHPKGIDHASLVGESEQTTILEAVHNDNTQAWVLPPYSAKYIPECPAGVPPYANCNINGVVQDMTWGTPLWGDYLKAWTMQNLTVRLSDPIPPLAKDDPRREIPRCADLPPGKPCEREFQAMAFWGGNGNYEFNHVTIEVMPGTTARVFGPHVMWGTTSGSGDGHGNLTIKDCTIENSWWGPIIMQSVGGQVTVSDLKTIDVGNPVDFEIMTNTQNTVIDGTFEYTGSSGTPTWDQRFNGVIQLSDTSNVDIEGNEIDGLPPVLAGILVYYLDHNITIHNNVLTDVIDTPTYSNGYPFGAIFSWPYGANTGITIMDNAYDPDAFAINLGANDSTIKEPTLTPDQVYVQGTNDTVKLGN